MDVDVSGQERWKASSHHHGKKPIRGDGPGNTGAGGARQLFDHRKHDPVKFSAAKRALNEPGSGPGTHSEINQHGKMNEEDEQQDEGIGTQDCRKPLSVVVQLKRAYKVIVRLETALKEEEFASKVKDEENKTREIRDGINVSGFSGVLRVDGVGRLNEDDYWVKLSKQHRDLAEAHHQFLEMSTDPNLPSTMHQLPQKYNIPTRLWQTGFHQLLERLRHALPTPSTSSSLTSSQHLLEHMTDFIYFAYGFYTNLFEEQTLRVFKSVWIEQLGDLARYRMAVAGLMTKISSSVSISKARVQVQSSDSEEERGVDRTIPRGRRNRIQQSQSEDSLDLDVSVHTSDDSASLPIPPPVVQVKKVCGSIGVGALGDWEFEEQEIWRSTARDWYSKGLAENPGTGRLHHHLALLSKGDELGTLYHYVKSLTASHPYLPARESILPFFESEHQSRRTRPEVSINDLFVHLHGMLFTKIQLDDFGHELARFMEKLTEDRLLSERDYRRSSISNSNWVMMAIINICALLQYGADEGVIRMSQKTFGGVEVGGGRGVGKVVGKSLMVAPHAILINQSSNVLAEDRRPSQSTSSEEEGVLGLSSDLPSDPAADTHNEPTTQRIDGQLKLRADVTDDESGPIVFTLAAKLSFDMLADALQSQLTQLTPYVTLMMTFLSSMSRDSQVMAKLERFVPWMQLAELFNSVPASIELNALGPESFKLVGVPLSEDWCLRGMEWACKSLFGRGYWKASKILAAAPTTSSGEHVRTQMGHESEMDVLLGFSSSRTSKLERSKNEEEEDLSRWNRIGIVGVWLSRTVPGFGFDPTMGIPHRFVVLQSLKNKIGRWKLEERREREELRVLKAKRTGKEKAMVEIDEEIDSRLELEEDDDEDEDPEAVDNELVRSLKARRRELRSILNQIKNPIQARPSIKTAQVSRAVKPVTTKKPTASLNVLPGYTVLVLDTNILIGMLSIVKDLLESERWTIVIPLVVITELDGLKKKSSSTQMMDKVKLSEDALEATKFLESSIKTKSRWLKIQTSKGNYLRDLWIRNEEIDFSGSDQICSTDHAHNLDDLVLRAAIWQIEHFGNSLPIISNNNNVVLNNSGNDNPEKVVLVTLDRNLRLKARARGMVAADEKQIIGLVEKSSWNVDNKEGIVTGTRLMG